MTTYIAQFVAQHKLIQIEQNSIFTWRQESGDVDKELLQDKIKRESSIYFYRLIAGMNHEIRKEDISITIWKLIPFTN